MDGFCRLTIFLSRWARNEHQQGGVGGARSLFLSLALSAPNALGTSVAEVEGGVGRKLGKPLHQVCAKVDVDMGRGVAFVRPKKIWAGFRNNGSAPVTLGSSHHNTTGNP